LDPKVSQFLTLVLLLNYFIIIIFFSFKQNKSSLYKFEIIIFHDFLSYCHMRSEIIQICTLWYLWWSPTPGLHIYVHKTSFHYFIDESIMKILPQASRQNSKATRAGGVSHRGLAIYFFFFLNILRQKRKKNYGNSNISQCQKHNLQKILSKKPKILQHIITL
jgi:hypothetical protein